MKLGPRQLEALRQLIVDHHQAFVANWVSPTLISDATRARLEALGIYKPKAKTVQDAYVLGVVAAQSPGAGDKMTYEQLKREIAAQPIPFSESEKQAIEVAQMSAGQYITGLGQRVANSVGAMALAEQPGPAEQYREKVRHAVAQNLLDRKTIKELKSDLGHATGDWCRDLERIANTETSAAMAQGTAQAAVRDFGPDVKMFFDHAPNCCKYCRKLVCEEDSDRPKVFSLKELEANGTNVGRKASQWRPVCAGIHVNCRCVLSPMPKGFEFDAKNDLVPIRKKA